MPRPKTLGDAEVLAAAHRLVHERGPSALTLQRWRGLAACRHPRWCNGSRASRSSCAAPCPMLGTVWTSGRGGRGCGAEDGRWRDRTSGGAFETMVGSSPTRTGCSSCGRTFATPYCGARRGLEGVAVAGHRGLLLRHAARTAGHRSAVGSAVAGVTAVVELDPQGDVVGYVEDVLAALRLHRDPGA